MQGGSYVQGGSYMQGGSTQSHVVCYVGFETDINQHSE